MSDMHYTIAHITPDGGFERGIPKYTGWFAMAEDGAVFASPHFINMGDKEAFLCCAYDGVAVIQHKKRLLVQMSWMAEQWPERAEQLKNVADKIREAFKRAGLLAKN